MNNNHHKKPNEVFLCSSFAGIICNSLTNPLDVIKVRLQNDAKKCHCMNASDCCKRSSPVLKANSIGNASIFKLVKCRNFEANYGVKCDCLPFGTNTKALIYLARKEGPLTLANGMLHGVATSTISAVTFFSFYEGARKEVIKHTSDPVMIPLLSALFARTVTTTLIFPFEYWKTVIQSTKRANKKSIFKIGKSFNAGFASLLTRDIVFACVNWVLLENSRDKLKLFLNSDQVEGDRGYQNKGTLLLSNFIAGGFAGAIGSLVSIPFDVVKTRKQLHHKEYKHRSILSILQEVYENEGRRGLFLGARQRVWKVTLQTAGIITLYELFMDMMRKGEIQQI